MSARELVYALKVAMLLPKKSGGRILLGIEGLDGDDRNELCRVKAVAGPRQNGIVYEQHFEHDSHGWRIAGGIEGGLDESATGPLTSAR